MDSINYNELQNKFNEFYNSKIYNNQTLKSLYATKPKSLLKDSKVILSILGIINSIIWTLAMIIMISIRYISFDTYVYVDFVEKYLGNVIFIWFISLIPMIIGPSIIADQKDKINTENKKRELQIQKYFKPNFRKIFPNLSWDVYDNEDLEMIQDDSVESFYDIKILQNRFKQVDDFITGTYKGINFKLLDVIALTPKIEKPKVIITITSIFVLLLFARGIHEICTGGLSFLGFIINVFLTSLFILAIGAFLVITIFKIHRSAFGKPFNGVIIQFDMNKNFEGETFISEKDYVRAVDLFKFETVNIEDSQFSQQYNIYSSNQIEARYILTTAFIERFKRLKETFNAEYVRAEFRDKKIYIIIHTGENMFDLKQYKELPTKKDFLILFNEIKLVLEIVDALKLNEKLGL